MSTLTSWLVRVRPLARLGNAGAVANADQVCRHLRDTEAAVEARLRSIPTHLPTDVQPLPRSA